MDLAQELLRRELIGSDELEEALRLQEREGLRLDQVLLRARRIDEPALLQVIGDLLAIPFVPEVAALEIDPRALEDLPPKVVFRRRIVPIARANGSLRVVTSDAYDLYAFDEARMLTGLRIEPVLAPQAEVDKLIKTHYGVGGDTVDAMMGVGETESASTSEGSQDLLEMAEEASVIRLVNEIIVEAIHERASDIHIEPYEHELAIRYRIDGVLQPAKLPPEIRRFQAAILSRIKILANMNIAEKRLPQDGRIQLTVGGRQVDLRVSVIPMLFGEGIVMRVLDKDSVLFTLPELGMDEESYRRFVGLIERPHGIILVTGPTGSGKTTTLYAALHAIVGPEKKVLTVEDPVEYHLEGVNQIPVVPSIGMTFERGLRAILRHDPDVVMIGEIRDLETAEAATQAALTGHLVLSTLHTNDAASAATRLIDMGVEPFLVSSTLVGAMAQRLVRRICRECREEWTPAREDLPLDCPIEPGARIWRGRGCPVCRHTGFRGRTGVYELLLNDEAVQEAILARAPSSRIVQVARQNGLRLLREDGWSKVLAGETTPSEVVRCTAV